MLASGPVGHWGIVMSGVRTREGIVVAEVEAGVSAALGAETLVAALDDIAGQLRSLVGAHQSAVSYIPDGDFTRAVHGMSLSDKYARYRSYDVMPTGKGIWSVIFEQAKPMRYTEAELREHPRFKRFSDMKDARGLEHPPLPGWLAVPVKRRDGVVIGLLQLSDREKDDFTAEDEALVIGVANLIAPTLEYEYMSAQLRLRTAQLERSNEDLHQFAYIASHDLQEPLRAISGFAQLLQRSTADRLTPSEQDQFGFIIEGTRRMQDLIQDLLEFSRVDTESLPFGDVDLNKIASHLGADLASLIERTGGRIEFGDLPTIRGDHRQVAQVLQNLVSNGLKFGRDVPPVVRISAERDGYGWTLSVEDYGRGMHAEDLHKVWGMFQRLQHRDEVSGTGIGLALVEKIVERHRGRASIESVVDKGTTVRVHFPDKPEGKV